MTEGRGRKCERLQWHEREGNCRITRWIGDNGGRKSSKVMDEMEVTELRISWGDVKRLGVCSIDWWERLVLYCRIDWCKNSWIPQSPRRLSANWGLRRSRYFTHGVRRSCETIFFDWIIHNRFTHPNSTSDSMDHESVNAIHSITRSTLR
jgi:hypothetical protein